MSGLRALQMTKQNSNSFSLIFFSYSMHARSYSDTSVSQKLQLTKKRINAFNRGRVSWKRRGSFSGLLSQMSSKRGEEEEKLAEGRKRDVNRNLPSPHLLLELWQLFTLRMSVGECWSDSSLGEART